MSQLIPNDEAASLRRERTLAVKRAYYARHRERILAEKKAQREAEPGAHRDGHLRRSYGISLQEYDALLEQQGGRCAGCGTQSPENARIKAFHVDHNHETGEVRGLLCRGCNVALGNVKDSVDTLMGLAAYLLQTQDVLIGQEA